MQAPARGFSQAEFERRTARAQAAMAAAKLDALLLTTEALVADKPEEAPAMPMGGDPMGGMGGMGMM